VIVVDTSVWIDALRDGRSAEAQALVKLLDADEVGLALPVRVELLSGVSRQNRASLKRSLSGVPVLKPTEDTWTTIEKWLAPSADRGFRFSIPDLLIAALAHDFGALVWSNDADFARMQDAGLVQLYAA
jgi:predicted nucleic acid-binding protein